jgi:hypothetical protein
MLMKVSGNRRLWSTNDTVLSFSLRLNKVTFYGITKTCLAYHFSSLITGLHKLTRLHCLHASVYRVMRIKT